MQPKFDLMLDIVVCLPPLSCGVVVSDPHAGFSANTWSEYTSCEDIWVLACTTALTLF